MSETGENLLRCPVLTRTGQPCQGRPGASGYCVGHDPAAAEWRAKGGKQTSNAARALKLIPSRLRPIADQLTAALDEVHTGALKPQQATAMAAVASALVRVVTSGEMEQRLRDLEANLAERERERQEVGL